MCPIANNRIPSLSDTGNPFELMPKNQGRHLPESDTAKFLSCIRVLLVLELEV